MRSVGLDFGTTNSAIGVAEPDGSVRLAKFPSASGLTETFRSILYFAQDRRDARGRLAPVAGPRAIDTYLASPGTQQRSLRLERWFAATEQYAKQLHEVERADYLAMKQNEFRRLSGPSNSVPTL